MPETLEALAVVVIALLPGALFVWSYERQTGPWGIQLPDRLFRFVGASAVLQAVAAPATFGIWRHYIRDGTWLNAERLSLVLWAAIAFYVIGPVALGVFVGRSTAAGRPWATGLAGHPPRGWDFFFSRGPDGWVRLRLKSGKWIGGAFDRDSWAAGYPEAGDLYIASAAEVDPDSGSFVFDGDGNVVLRDSGILIDWQDVEYLEFNDG